MADRIFIVDGVLAVKESAETEQIDLILSKEGEEIDVSIFGGLHRFAKLEDLSDSAGSWVFNSTNAIARKAEYDTKVESNLEEKLINLSLKKDKAESLGLSSKAAEIQSDINAVNVQLQNI